MPTDRDPIDVAKVKQNFRDHRQEVTGRISAFCKETRVNIENMEKRIESLGDTIRFLSEERSKLKESLENAEGDRDRLRAELMGVKLQMDKLRTELSRMREEMVSGKPQQTA